MLFHLFLSYTYKEISNFIYSSLSPLFPFPSSSTTFSLSTPPSLPLLPSLSSPPLPQWVRIQPTGLVHFKTKLDGYHYSWNKPHTTVHNLIIGQLWADHEGVVTVTSHQTGDQAVVNWNPHGKVKDRYRNLNGKYMYIHVHVIQMCM